jgi:hypothetical protein
MNLGLIPDNSLTFENWIKYQVIDPLIKNKEQESYYCAD